MASLYTIILEAVIQKSVSRLFYKHAPSLFSHDCLQLSSLIFLSRQMVLETSFTVLNRSVAGLFFGEVPSNSVGLIQGLGYLEKSVY